MKDNTSYYERPCHCVQRLAILTLLITLAYIQIAVSFVPSGIRPNFCGSHLWRESKQNASYDPDAEVNRRLARAREVLAKSKAKMESKGTKTQEKTTVAVPFYATKTAILNPRRRERLSKAFNEQTGLVQADGDKMAALSEQEEWEYRSLLEVFRNEIKENGDVYSDTSQQLASRDVAASIWNLRKTMQTEDYQRIFDKRNWFIGEDM